MTDINLYKVGDVIRMPNVIGGYRCWKVTGVYLGAEFQESTYELYPIDFTENKVINVPVIILETHPKVSLI